MPTAQEWIEKLDLQPHPEGGFFREAYRAAETIAADALPARFGGERNHSTAIFFLLRAGDVSALHRIQADEVWHHYDGGPLLIHVIGKDGAHTAHRLGKDLAKGELPQLMVPHGLLFGSEPAPGTEFALVGCTVAPGFDFADFEMPKRDELQGHYPQHADLLERLGKA